MAVTDNFTDTDGTTLPAHSANWVEPTSGITYNNITIKTNAVHGAVNSAAVYTGTTFSNDQYAQVTVSDLADTHQQVVIRTGATGLLTGYGGGIRPATTGHNRYVIYDFTDDAIIATHGSQVMTAGDTVKISATGTTVKLFVNGSEILSVEDATDGSGYPALFLWDTGTVRPLFDDFEAGDAGGGSPTVTWVGYIG